MKLYEILDSIKEYIEKRLKDYLPHDAPMFKTILRSSVMDIMGLKIYPALMMEYGKIEVERETPHSDSYDIPITFYCISNGADSEKLQALSEKYVWALKTLFEIDPHCGGFVRFADIKSYEFSPSLVRQQSFIHVGIIEVIFNVSINRKEV